MQMKRHGKQWMDLVGNIPIEQRFQFDMETVKTFGSLDIQSFAVSHDAADPMFYIFMKMIESLLLLQIQAM